MFLIGVIGLVFVTALFFLLWWLIEPSAVESIVGRHETGRVKSDLPQEKTETHSDDYSHRYGTKSAQTTTAPGFFVSSYTVPNFQVDDKGAIGERRVADTLYVLDRDKYYTINNLLLPVNGSSVQIDHVVVSVFGVFVIETKNYKGVIFGDKDSENWDHNVYGIKYQFRNPVLQNLGHLGALKYTLRRNDDIFIPIVVFSGDCVLRVNAFDNIVVTLPDLKDRILSFDRQVLSIDEANQIVAALLHANISSRENDRKHIEEVKRKAEDAEKSIRSGICPRCGAELVMKTEGYQTFMVCKNHPRCSFSTKPNH